MRLRGLGPDEVAALARAGAAEAEAIVAETGGNPLLVTHDGGGHRGSLAALLPAASELLDDETRAVLDLAATFGAEFDADLLAPATARRC